MIDITVRRSVAADRTDLVASLHWTARPHRGALR